MPAGTQNNSQRVLYKPLPNQGEHKMYINICWPKHSYASEDLKYITTCVGQTPSIPERTQNISWLVLTKTLPCQQEHKMNLNMCWPIPTLATDDTKYNSSCDYQITPMSAKTQNVSRFILTKFLPCHQWHKIYLNVCWPNSSHASEDTKCISTCVHQSPEMPVRTQHVFQDVLTKPIPCQSGHKIYLNMSWSNPSHAREDTKQLSTCV